MEVEETLLKISNIYFLKRSHIYRNPSHYTFPDDPHTHTHPHTHTLRYTYTRTHTHLFIKEED